MSPRARYARMTPEDLSADLKRLGITANDFARISGAQYERVVKWLEGREDAPPWVPVVTALLALPGGLEKARETAAFYLEREDSI